MRTFVKSSVLLLFLLMIAGCSSWVDGAKRWFTEDEDGCEVVTVTVYLPPVVANLDYQSITSTNSQAIVLGGYQHVLSIPESVRSFDVLPEKTSINSASVKETEIIRFDYDRVSLDTEDRQKLDRLLAMIKARGIRSVAIEGHTDSKGSMVYNQRLSLRRAENVKSYLVGGGIEQSKISVTGYGERKPVSPNTSAYGRAMNRRATLIFPGDLK